MRVLVVFLSFCFCVTAVAAAPAAKQVLIIHSYQYDYQWTRLQHTGIMSELDSAEDFNVQVKAEYLDSKRAWNAGKASEFARHLASQYADYRPDLLIATDDDALTFLDAYGDAIFGAVPVVFSGINDFRAERIASRRGLRAGVSEYNDFGSTLASLRTLFPQVTEVRILADESTTGRQTAAEFFSAVEASAFPLPVLPFRSLALADVLAEAKSLPPTTAVVILAYARDSAGTDHGIASIVSALTEATSGPVFSSWDFNFGYGIVGGALTSGFAQGREAGRIALKILRGESAASIPVSELRDPPLTFDWRVLKRFGISERKLPAGSIVRFRPKSLYEQDPSAFLVIAAVISILALVVVFLSIALVVVRRAQLRLRVTDEALSKSLAEKDVLLKEVHHRVKNNFQLISSLLNLQASEMEEIKARTALSESESRVRSMALIHERLYEEKDFSAIDFGEYARALAEKIKTNYGEAAAHVSMEVDAEASAIGLDRSVPLGLLLNELLTNAFKYAFPDGRAGRIRVTFRAKGEGGCTLSIADDGVGLPESVDFAAPRSLGLQLVRVLADQLGASVSLDRSEGTRFDLLLRPSH